MKLSESQAFKLFDKYGIKHPKILIPSKVEGSHKIVVKADIPLGGKKKAGLVKICTKDKVKEVSDEIKDKLGEMGYGDEGEKIIIEEYIVHEAEFFVAIRPTRDGLVIYTSDKGGIDVEQNWDKVHKQLVTSLPAGKAGHSSLDPFIRKLTEFFEAEDAMYLEINPYTEKNVALGVVLEVDETAAYRHPDWADTDRRWQTLTDREEKIREIDEQIRGSVKLVEVPGGGNTAVMGGGAGAVLFLCDAVINKGLGLANYAEFSGNPPAFAVTELTKQVCAIPGIKNLVIGSGIANFTDVKSNIEGIIKGLKESPQAQNLSIVVRRCGPREQEAKKIMEAFAERSGLQIQVFDRYTGMTEIVSKLKKDV